MRYLKMEKISQNYSNKKKNYEKFGKTQKKLPDLTTS